MKPKQISLHELPFTEIVKFGTIRLASSDYQHIWNHGYLPLIVLLEQNLWRGYVYDCQNRSLVFMFNFLNII